MPPLPLLFLFLSLLKASLCFIAVESGQAPISFDTPAASTPLWDPPSPNATDHLVFSSVSSLLHTWHNARYRNGHTIVPGTIPKGTLLFHGTSEKKVPTTPEWTALDPEFSQIFCHAARGTGSSSGGDEEQMASQRSAARGGCWHLTLRTTRPLNILYFDGSSAAKMYGPLDAQDLIVFGDDFAYDGTDSDSPSRVFIEPERLRRLCQWGKKYELDGFVRMQSALEVMLCDFTAGVEEVSFLNIVSEMQGAKPPSEKRLEARDGPQEPSQTTLVKVHSAIDVGLRHGSSSPFSIAETRVHLDLTRLVSFYDTDLFPSLVRGRASSKPLQGNRTEHQSRLLHGLLDTQRIRGSWRVGAGAGISRADRDRLLEKLDEVLRNNHPTNAREHAIDWASLYRQVKDRYAERFEILHHILSSSSDNDGESLRRTLLNAHMYIDDLLAPYILYGVRPPLSASTSGTSTMNNIGTHPWATPILEHCSKHFVPPSSHEMTHSERLLISGLRGTTHEICRVLVHLWATAQESGITVEGIPTSDLVAASRAA
ncbi:hypothetical protein NMY22_g725 [Coprinellus aureogranulatus]|nr:hypothetical protein NMY22_g725 [Coprinellus aureogranulatus]